MAGINFHKKMFFSFKRSRKASWKVIRYQLQRAYALTLKVEGNFYEKSWILRKLRFCLYTHWHLADLLAKKAIFQPEKEFSFTFFHMLKRRQRRYITCWKRCAIVELIWDWKEIVENVTAKTLQKIFTSTHATFFKFCLIENPNL